MCSQDRGPMRDPRRVLLPNPPFPLLAATCRGLRPHTMAVVHFKQAAPGPGLQVFHWPTGGRGSGTHRGSSIITVQVPEGFFYSKF